MTHVLPLDPKYAGSSCEIKTMDNELLTIVHIIKIDHDALEFSAPQYERIPLLQYRSTVKVIVHNSKLSDQVLVGTTYLSTNNFLRVEDVRPLSKFERRGAFRVTINESGKLLKFLSESQQRLFDQLLTRANPEEAKRMLADTNIPVQIIDLSLTGARLKSEKPLMLGDKYYLEFLLLDNKKHFGMRVQRIIEMDDGTEQYGAIFFDISAQASDVLCRDLFQMQRIEKNRRSNTAF